MSAIDEENPYEAQRLANIAKNKALLESLGLGELRIPDAQPKPSKKKTKPPPAKKRKIGKHFTADGGNGSGDETVVEDENGERLRKPRPTLKSEDNSSSQDTPVLGARRSSRNIRRISYANNGARVLAQRQGRAKLDDEDDDSEDYKSEPDADNSGDEFDEGDSDEERPRRPLNKKRRKKPVDERNSRQVAKLGNREHDPKQFGSIPGVEVGAWFDTRAACSQAAVHAPWVAGIHGDGEEGAFSIALSGGYPDDIDLGEAFTYTGAGGRALRGTKDNPKNLRTAPQSCDQSFSHHLNKTLKASTKTKNPVRVIRGFKLPSVYAPKEGYRYDGLYRVEKAWMDMGVEGFMVCKYALKRLPGQPPLPEADTEDQESEEGRAGSESDDGAET